MADGTGQPVDDRLLILVDMAVGVGNAVGMHVGMVMFVGMVAHMPTSFLCFSYHTPFFPNFQPPMGVVSGTDHRICAYTAER